MVAGSLRYRGRSRSYHLDLADGGALVGFKRHFFPCNSSLFVARSGEQD
jgi:hypothetical protein